MPSSAAVLTPVERAFVQEGQRQEHYASEKMPAVVEVENVGVMGKLVCLRFLEYVLEHPTGVVSLPTGRTPEMFIAYLKYYREHWAEPETQAELAHYGLMVGPTFPDTSGLRFVQLDEFMPIYPEHKHSFVHYVRSLYFPLLNLKAENILTMDFVEAGVLPKDPQECEEIFDHGIVNQALLKQVQAEAVLKQVQAEAEAKENTNGGAADGIPDFVGDGDNDSNNKLAKQKLVLEKATKFAYEYEQRICEWGGIGFFLGGIGPDGHIAFNQPGSAHDSPTRLVTLNYMTAAAASADLGGIEYSRNKAAMTIGLGTITHKADATIIVMAAGEGKAHVVADAIEGEPSLEIPATCLHVMPGARFYVSRGAACLLDERKTETLQRKVVGKTLTDEDVDTTLIDLALRLKKRLVDLTEAEVEEDPRAGLLLVALASAGKRKREEGGAAAAAASLETLVAGTVERLHDKITRGQVLAKDKRILHTAPHHDDIMLSYHAALPGLMETNTHWFTYLTSGFHSVTNSYMLSILTPAASSSDKGTHTATTTSFITTHARLALEATYPEVVEAFVAAHARGDTGEEAEIESIICLRQIAKIWSITTVEELQKEVDALVDFFTHQLPGDKSPVKVQLLKGAMRETEADRMWALRGVAPASISHLRCPFYTDDFFTPLPTIEDDAMPMVKLLKDFAPDIVTVAFDPEGTGPDTHYKVLQVVAQAIRMGFDTHTEEEDATSLTSQIGTEGLTVWGYRNVWFRFHMSDTTVMAPVNDKGLEEMNDAFLSCFSTQKDASFPAPDYDGPFSKWSEVSQRAQRENLGVVLGEAYFASHPDAKVRESTGYVFLKEMNREAFINSAAQLKGRIEANGNK